MPVLWKLQLRQKEKIVLTGLFALGFFVTVIQIARIFRVKNLKTVTDSEMLILWSIIEVSLGAIITCIPTFGPLFKSFATTVSSYRHNSSGRSYPLNSIPKGATKSKDSNNNASAIFGSHTDNTGTTVQSGQRGGLTSHESGSQERILGAGDRAGIYKSVDFTVEKF
ncbi:unnamed protein product [Penicillium bialowiezense]